MYGSADDEVEIDDIDELDSCLLSFPTGMSSFGEPRFCLGNVEYLALFVLTLAGVDVMPPLIRSKSLMSPASSLYWSNVSWKLSIDSLKASRTSSEEWMMSGWLNCNVVGGDFFFMIGDIGGGMSCISRCFSRSFCS